MDEVLLMTCVLGTVIVAAILNVAVVVAWVARNTKQ
jgi:hypothetical protein